MGIIIKNSMLVKVTDHAHIHYPVTLTLLCICIHKIITMLYVFDFTVLAVLKFSYISGIVVASSYFLTFFHHS